MGIIIFNEKGRLLWAKRLGQDAWQFPQGGVQQNESLEQAAFRELNEEVGLAQEDVEIIASTDKWLRYKLPRHLIRPNSRPLCIGQKQKWYLMRLLSDAQKIRFDLSDKPEFDHWRWVNYWYPVNQVVSFKRKVYKKALEELVQPFKNALQDKNS